MLDRAALKSYRNEILMLIAPYLAEISLVLYFEILQNMQYFCQIMNSNRLKNFKTYVLRVALSEGTNTGISLKNLKFC
jgi:hypothetical protein